MVERRFRWSDRCSGQAVRSAGMGSFGTRTSVCNPSTLRVVIWPGATGPRPRRRPSGKRGGRWRRWSWRVREHLVQSPKGWLGVNSMRGARILVLATDQFEQDGSLGLVLAGLEEIIEHTGRYRWTATHWGCGRGCEPAWLPLRTRHGCFPIALQAWSGRLGYPSCTPPNW
jgi:hypothetical protein